MFQVLDLLFASKDSITYTHIKPYALCNKDDSNPRDIARLQRRLFLLTLSHLGILKQSMPWGRFPQFFSVVI